MARKILLADDSVTAQNMGRKILADAGYEVIAVNNGSAALKKIAELKPDLVILDVYMPGYSGLEVCQRLKESQETARIPVLLTVGKLEPFKPEEAQRVRAEGFIVKPFEASELLSTLSKLEDKVVPRAEPSKPGRFARAIAAAEESGRSGRNEAGSDDTGWKSRIGFPKQKAESEEKIADEVPIYNAMNRDLRTVVETPAEKASAEKEAEGSLDVAALVPAGLPKDVTPEEVAAIAAAAAQMQAAVSAIKGEHPPSISPIPESQVDAKAEASTTGGETGIKKEEEDKLESAAAEARKYYRRKDDVRPDDVKTEDARSKELRAEDEQEVPVTMAATAESVAASAGGSRWTAVSVALEGSEAAISLDHEMQKAYAAYAATGSASRPAESASVGVSEPAPAAALSVSSIAEAEPEPESAKHVAPYSAPAETEPVPPPQPEASAIVSSIVAPDASPNFVTSGQAFTPESTGTSNQQSDTQQSDPVASAPAVVEVPAAAAFTEPNQEHAPVAEFVRPVAETEIAVPAASDAEGSRPQPAPQPAIIEAASASSNPSAPIISESEAGKSSTELLAESASEPRLDQESVKSTAAAWASWRENRDTSQGSESAEAQPGEFNQPETAPLDTAARAVAAGAERIVQEAAAAAPTNGDSPNVASIVDSVLADLRPKLMEEISRKMSEKK